MINFMVNCSTASDITAHLLRADSYFEPPLSSRVDIHDYSKKLNDKAVRFEAWISADLVGLVAIYCNQFKDSKAFVSSVSVLPESQGQGIASHLMRQCINHLEIGGFYHLGLEVDKRNLSALSLYRRLGFTTLQSSGTLLFMEKTIERENK